MADCSEYLDREANPAVSIGWFMYSGWFWHHLEHPAPYSWLLMAVFFELFPVLRGLAWLPVEYLMFAALDSAASLFGIVEKVFESRKPIFGASSAILFSNFVGVIVHLYVWWRENEQEVKDPAKAAVLQTWTTITSVPTTFWQPLLTKVEAYLTRLLAHQQKPAPNQAAGQLTRDEVDELVAGIVRRSTSAVEHLDAEINALRSEIAALRSSAAETEAKLRTEINRLSGELEDHARYSGYLL